ncbi:hypothetical protein WG66_007620, partial [Moniliophthora roreri]
HQARKTFNLTQADIVNLTTSEWLFKIQTSPDITLDELLSENQKRSQTRFLALQDHDLIWIVPLPTFKWYWESELIQFFALRNRLTTSRRMSGSKPYTAPPEVTCVLLEAYSW